MTKKTNFFREVRPNRFSCETHYKYDWVHGKKLMSNSVQTELNEFFSLFWWQSNISPTVFGKSLRYYVILWLGEEEDKSNTDFCWLGGNQITDFFSGRVCWARGDKNYQKRVHSIFFHKKTMTSLISTSKTTINLSSNLWKKWRVSIFESVYWKSF